MASHCVDGSQASLCWLQSAVHCTCLCRWCCAWWCFAGGACPSAWFSWGWGVATGLASVQEQPSLRQCWFHPVLELLRPRHGGHGGHGGMGVVGAQHRGGVTLRSSRIPTASGKCHHHFTSEEMDSEIQGFSKGPRRASSQDLDPTHKEMCPSHESLRGEAAI